MELTIDQALQKGITAHRLGQIQEADRMYTAILKSQPTQPDANHNMGVLAVGVGELVKALPFFQTALNINPNIEQYWISYVNTLTQLGQIDMATKAIEQAKEIGISQRKLCRLDKDLNEVSLTGVNRSELKDPSTVQVKGLIELYNQRKFQKVLENVTLLLNEFPNSAILYNIYATTNKSLGKLDIAVRAYKNALLLKPDYLDVYNNMGNALKEQGKLNDAIAAYNNAIKINPDYADAYNNLGTTLLDKGNLKEAIKAYKKSIDLNPNFPMTYNNMGFALQKQGKPEKAILAYKEALRIKPDYAEAYANTAELLKIYSPKNAKGHVIHDINDRVKKLGVKLIAAKLDQDISHILSESLDCLSKSAFNFKTKLSQIYLRNSIDLNCNRHIKIFNSGNIIPQFCFCCYKVEIEVGTLIDLIRLTAIFYKLELDDDLTRKTIIELRPNIPGFYKGFIYCSSLNQAEKVKAVVDLSLRANFQTEPNSRIKRGCSEFSLSFPQYGRINDKNKLMVYPTEWKRLEEKFDKEYDLSPKENLVPSKPEFCLSDFYIIQKWIDYAKGLGDPSCGAFEQYPLIFPDIYDKAVLRKAESDKV